MKLLMVGWLCLSLMSCNLVPNSKPITNQQLESDLVSKKISVSNPMLGGGWTFEKNEKRCVNIVEANFGTERAVIVADVVTSGVAGGGWYFVGISGQIEVYYSKIGDRWVIEKLENKGIEVDYATEAGKRIGKSEEEVQAKTKSVCQSGFDNSVNKKSP